MRSDAERTSQERLRRLARHALSQYPLDEPRITLLSNKEHAVFRVDAREAIRPYRERFAMRLYSPDAFHHPSVVTEVEWLVALRRDAGLQLPEPIPSCDGTYMARAQDSDESRTAVCFRWVDGRRRTTLTPASLVHVGRFVARLHDHASRFVPSVGHKAQQWSWQRVFGNGSPLAPGSDAVGLPRQHRELFDATALRLRTVMDDLGTAPDVWGLIHGDLHAGNYLFHGSAEVRAIDFEDCGWGYYLYDLAVVIDHINASYPEKASVLREGLLEGYRETRDLGDSKEALPDLFVAMRLAELVRWHATSKNSSHRNVVPQLVREAVDHMSRTAL